MRMAKKDDFNAKCICVNVNNGVSRIKQTIINRKTISKFIFFKTAIKQYFKSNY